MVFNEHIKESSGHYLFSNFFETVEQHLVASPAVLNQVAEDGNDWEADPSSFERLRSITPLAKRLVRTIDGDEDYDPEKIYSYYDEYVQPEEANLIRQLDKMIRRRFSA